MSIATLITYQRLPEKTSRFSDPSWDQVESAIRALDGIQLTEVMLLRGDAVGMHLIGGLYGRYFCEVHLLAGVKHLVDESRPEDNTVTVIQGEDPEFPESFTSYINVII